MDVVKAATVGAIAACAALVLLTTTKHGHTEPPGVIVRTGLSSTSLAQRVSETDRSAEESHTVLVSREAGLAAPRANVRIYGASLFPRPLFAPAPGSPWDLLIDEASRRFGIPASWVRGVMQVESAGRTTLNGRPITSTAGAMGLMQVMPETFAEMTRRYGLGSDPYEPSANILAGTAFLREMYDRFGTAHFLAAYNAGPGRVEEHLRSGRPLPDETRRYVQTLAPRLIGGTASQPPPASADVRDLTSLQALRDAARSPSRHVSQPLSQPPATPEFASVFVVSNERSSARDRQLEVQGNDALFVRVTRQDQRDVRAGVGRPED